MNRDATSRSMAMFAVASAVIFLAWLGRYINLDFFCDEIYSLMHYILVPLGVTITDASLANNHFFANVINNIFLTAAGQRDFYALLDHPWVARIPCIFYTAASIFLVWRLAKDFFGPAAAAIAVILLTTTIPYYNFAVQVRGYSLSILLCTALIYLLWRFEETGRFKHGLAATAVTVLLLYIMPSNLYIAFGMGLFYFGSAVFGVNPARKALPAEKTPSAASGKKQRKGKPAPSVQSAPPRPKNANFGLMAILAAGTILAGILYLPLLGQMMDNPIMESKGPFYFPTLFKMLPFVLHAFVSWRYLLAIATVTGLVMLFSRNATGIGRERARRMVFCAVTLLVPFIASFVRGDRPFDRVFVTLVPVFVVMMAAGTAVLLERFRLGEGAVLLAVAAVFVYSHATFVAGIVHMNHRIRNDIVQGSIRSQDLLCNYFQSDYHPRAILKTYRERFASPTVPLVVWECDQSALPPYMHKENVPAFYSDALEAIFAQVDSAYILTAESSLVKARLDTRFPGYSFDRVDTRPDFHSLFLLHKKR